MSGCFSNKSSASGYSGILKGKTQLGDISEDVHPLLLSDKAGWRIEHSGLDLSQENGCQSIRYASRLYNRDILAGSQTDFFQRIACNKICGCPKLLMATEPPLSCSAFLTSGHHDDIGTRQSAVHDSGTCYLTDGNFPRDKS